MDRLPKISIITPSYNQAPFIRATIESILSQAGNFAIEYIVMDGGSTDGSVDIIREYAERVSAGSWPAQCASVSMEWVSERDKGQSDAINKGLRRATGDILSYLNSDDTYVPGAFEELVQGFAAHPEADIIYGDGDVIDAAGNTQWEWLSRPYDHAVMRSYHFLWNDFTNYIMQQATFWRRSLQDKIGLFDESFHYAMDAEYWIRAGHMGARLIHIPAKLGQFRLIEGTKSLSSPTIFWADYLEIFRRYGRGRSMTLFFAYFYYNLGRQFGYDMAQAREQGQHAFAQWQALPPDELRALESQASKGFARACLMLASDVYSQGENAKASTLFRLGLFRSPLLAMHPFALRYYIQRASGQRITAVTETWARRGITWYRAHRYQYRYLQRETRSP